MPVAALAPSFVDLRAFAAQAPVAAGDDAFRAGRHRLPGPEGPLKIAALRFAAGTGTVTGGPADEFLLLLEGALAIRGDDGDIALSDGDCAMLPAASRFGWTAAADTTAIVIAYRSGSTPGRVPVKVDMAAALEPSAPPSAELLLTPTPACRNHVDYRSTDGLFYCGTWDSTPYARRHLHFGHCELMALIEGDVTLEDAGGRSAHFTAGDAVIVLQGADVSWHATGYVKKAYCMYRPA